DADLKQAHDQGDEKRNQDDARVSPAGSAVREFLKLNFDEVAAAQDESDRRKDIEPDRNRFTPALRIWDEVRADHDEAAQGRDEERNGSLHSTSSTVRKARFA